MGGTAGTKSNIQDADRAILADALGAKFGVAFQQFDDAEFELLVLGPKEILFEEGDQGADVYVVLGGRLRAFRRTSKGSEIFNEMGRGETVGELAFLLNAPRSASVMAIRETRIARFSRADFELLLSRRPQLATEIMRLAIERFRNKERTRSTIWRPVVIAVLKLSPQVDIIGFVHRLAKARSKLGGSSEVVTKADLPRCATEEPGPFTPHGSVARFLNDRAAVNEALFVVVDLGSMPFAALCFQLADEIVLVASGSDAPQEPLHEMRAVDGDANFPRANQTLVLLYRAGAGRPLGTNAWLSQYDVLRHFHVREEADRDWSRLARVLAGQAVGLVLSGGGARGLAEIGVLQALHAAGVDPDYLGGTSIGAIISAFDAIEIQGETLVETGRAAFKANLLKDYNIAPVVSLIKGMNVQDALRRIIKRTFGSDDVCSEDTWKTHFCIGSNYSGAREEVLRRGLLWRNLVASASIPGIFPPQIIDGNLIFDGATFNNFPVDVMEQQGAAYIIGVDMLAETDTRIASDRFPNAISLLVDRWRRRSGRRYQLPLLHETLFNAALLGSQAKQRLMRSRVDLNIAPTIEGVGWLDWSRYDDIVQMGYETASREIEKLDSGILMRIQAN
ncbi:cyclic nucleotide-binding and patatin-like phospholipase domain-containing protein [Rhodoblastus sp.]|mgnify:CR=1 FL=1|jgi:NTE family protein|uniref:cyclic nucleotide-binding and patatin-like phospholipase domain-containing protein n=1 Tax=Rhodoblastus sp. TaxID=1962975 RepID=UPI0025F88134|nr:cyclic nucleotide-binding and patatin-like phospholipase domain-containing protein [Rhodoblastus sp.]